MGSVVLEVKQCNPAEGSVDCIVMNNAKIGERKNMNLPGVHVDLPVLGDKDKDDILNFGIPQGVDFVAASFVQSADDVRLIRKTLGLRGRSIKIISKIENEAGLKNFDDILAKSDGIMVARGDLGMEIPTEKVFLAQKIMIGKCNLAGKICVTATQMLESMTGNPRPTRAEAENAIEYSLLYRNMRDRVTFSADAAEVSVPESICSSAVKASIDCNAKLILALTETGRTAHLVAKYRPSVPILALSATEGSVKQLTLDRGVLPLQVQSFQGTDSVLKSAMETAKNMGLITTGDTVICVHGA